MNDNEKQNQTVRELAEKNCPADHRILADDEIIEKSDLAFVWPGAKYLPIGYGDGFANVSVGTKAFTYNAIIRHKDYVSKQDYARKAKELFESEGDLEFDDNPKVSRSDEVEDGDDGAYVACWKWISKDQFNERS